MPTPPSPRTSWQGTVVTENVTSPSGNASDFIPGFLSTPLEQGSSFSFDTSNEFTDSHNQDQLGVVLAAGIARSTYTMQQTFYGGASHSYPFLITRTAVRQHNIGKSSPDDVKIYETEAHQ